MGNVVTKFAAKNLTNPNHRLTAIAGLADKLREMDRVIIVPGWYLAGTARTRCSRVDYGNKKISFVSSSR